MKRILTGAATGLGKVTYGISAVSVGLLCLLTIIDTFSRAIGSGSVAVIFDLNETLIVLVAFLALGYAQLSGDHVAFTVLYDRLPRRVQNILRVSGYVLALPLIAWMMWVTTGSVLESWQTAELRMGVANLPVWPARLAAAVGLLGYTVALIYGILASLRRWPEYPLKEFAHGKDTDEEEGR